MSNWVYNRVYCNKNVKEKIENYDDENGIIKHFYTYGYESEEISDNKFLLEFETHGSEYRNDFIEYILNEYKDTIWQCIEENLVEEAKFYVLDGKIKMDSHKLIFSYSDSLFDYLSEYEGFYISWPHLTISLIESNRKLLIHNLDDFEFYEYKLEDNDYDEFVSILEKYKSILSEFISFYRKSRIINTFYFLDNHCIEDTNDADDTRNEEELDKVKEFFNCLNKVISKYSSNYKINFDF